MASKKPANVTETLSQQAKSLLTTAERKLLESSFGSALAKASREAAQATLARVRTMRTKWRDLYASQSRSTKRSPRAGGAPASAANVRSLEKSELFEAAIKRIEARLSELAAGIASAAASPKAKKPRRAAASKPSISKASMGKPANTKKASKRSSAKRSRKALSPDTLGTLSAAAGGQAIRFDKSQQRSAKRAARMARAGIEGSSTRNSHMVALGRRAQVRRDLRNKK